MPGCVPMFDDSDIADLASSLALVFVAVGNSFKYILNYSLSTLKLSSE